MKLTRHLSAALLAGTVMMFSATAQAQITTSPGENTTTTPGSTTLDTANDIPATQPNSNADISAPDVNITNNVPPAQGSVTQPQSTTRIEVQNQVPAANNAPAPAPNIDIDMPDMPDINVTNPNTADSGTNERVTERSERVIINDDNDADATNNNILFMAIFGVLAIFLVAVIAMVLSRRRTIDQF